MSNLCFCGCGFETKNNNKFILGHNRRNQKHTKEARKKLSISHIGKIPTNKGKKLLNNESKIKMRNSHLGKRLSFEVKKKMSNSHLGKKKKPFSEDHKRKLGDKNRGKTYEQLYGKIRSDIIKEKSRLRMLNGLAIKMIKSIKKISNEEIKLRELVKELYPSCVFQYSVFRYSLDIALPEYKIAIEYDGYYHFNTEENIKYHKFRQEKIESLGWKFLKYTMFDKFPTLDQLKNDLKRLN